MFELQWSIRPYLMDLETVNGTFLNGEREEPLRYYELMAQVRRSICLHVHLPEIIVLQAQHITMCFPLYTYIFAGELV
jgi:hypothetical protein